MGWNEKEKLPIVNDRCTGLGMSGIRERGDKRREGGGRTEGENKFFQFPKDGKTHNSVGGNVEQSWRARAEEQRKAVVYDRHRV